MKKTLTVILCLLLVAVLAMSLVACGEKKEEIPKKDPVSQYKADGFEKSTLKNQVSWEGINQFKPTTEIAKLYATDKDAAIKEARQIAIDFFNYAKTATWIPADTWEFTHHDDGTGPDTMQGGQVYGGLPYVGLASSAIYRVMDFIDEETGVVNIYAVAGKEHETQKMFGNQCANGAYQGWSRFINSAKYSGTPSMTLVNGFIPVGPYTYDEYISKWTEGYNTKAVVSENEEQTLYESYAQMIPADGFVNFTTAGHVMMLIAEPEVVKNDDGTINGNLSNLYITDQHVQFVSYTHPDGGDQCQLARYVNRKFTFAEMRNSGYLPFTYKEWLGEDPIEVPETTVSVEGDSITLGKLFETKVKSNYHIYDIYVEIYDAVGNEIVKVATHNRGASNYEIKFMRAGEQAYVWGNLDSLAAGKEYTAKIYAQLGTGERPDLWEGKLIVE